MPGFRNNRSAYIYAFVCVRVHVRARMCLRLQFMKLSDVHKLGTNIFPGTQTRPFLIAYKLK